MNKLEGFYQLQSLGIPAVSWRQFTGDKHLDPSLLWTIRVAVEHGDDMNLPRAVGVTAEAAFKAGLGLLNRYKDTGMVVYYPYFIALKSGTLELTADVTIIEAVKDDLWNLTTDGGRDITIVVDWRTRNMSFYGKKDFLKSDEIEQLMACSGRVRARLKDYINVQTSVLLEWSYAVNTDVRHLPICEPYLLFYECRTIKAS